MKPNKTIIALLTASLILTTTALAVNWHQLFEVHTNVEAIEGVTVWFASPGPTLTSAVWWQVVDGDIYSASMHPGDVERFYVKVEHLGDTPITLLACITFPAELTLYDISLPETAATWWDGNKYYIQYTMNPGTVGGDYTVWVEYRLAGWADLGTYTLDFNMKRG